MLKYAIKRLLLAILTILIISMMAFFIMHAVPGGPFNREKALSPATIEALNARYGLDKPPFTQFVNYMKAFAKGDFGLSLKNGREIRDIFRESFPISARLGLSAMLLALTFGILFGCIAAIKRNKWQDRTIIFFSTLFTAVPGFVLATLLLLVFSIKLGLVPVWTADKTHYLPPVIALAAYPAAYTTRLAKTSMLDTLGQDYIRTARAKGVPEWKVIGKHALRNSLIPVITYAGPQIAYIITGSMVIENPYYWDAANIAVDKLEFMLSADDNAIFAAYNSGNLDFADTVPSDAVAQLVSTKDPEFHTVDKIGTYYAAFNSKSPPLFKGKTPAQAACMREAISMLIDRDYICENIAQTGQAPANAFIPIGISDGNGGIFKSSVTEQGYFDPYAINNDTKETIAKAISLLRAAGYEFDASGRLSARTPISITYLTNTNSSHIATAEAIQQDLAMVGINLTIQERDWNVFLKERKKGNFDFAREGRIADFDDPINMLEMWTSASGNNDCQFGK